MNGVLEFPSVKLQESDTDVLKQFATQCIQDNKSSVIQMISALNKPDLTYIVETVSFKIMSLVLTDKNKEEILEYVAGGTYYKLTHLLIEGFLNDQDIISNMQKRA
ncbi:hypothetical protein [Cytobacillus oceanisediminis]|uniref:hypothetical protein n=1 Tax=Cytobacillus oceanisediminis TaxID=665099 RepID=UPI003735FFB9